MGERKEHTTSLDAQQQAASAIGEATDSSHWMTATWAVRNGRVELTCRTTYQFPRDRFAEAVGLLAIDLAGERQGSLPGPLPMAHVRPYVEEPQSPVVDGPEDESLLDDDEEDDVE